MFDCIECIDEVYKDDEGFEAMLFPELERGFEGGVVSVQSLFWRQPH